MPFSDCLSNTMNVCVDFLCLDFGAVGSRNPKINVSAVGHRRRSSVVRGTPVQVAASFRWSVAQTWYDWIWRSACACAVARQTCRSNRAAKVQRLAPAPVNAKQPWQHIDRMHVHVFLANIRTVFRLKNTCIFCTYMHVFLHKYVDIRSYTYSRCPQQGVSICTYSLEIHSHTAPVNPTYGYIEVIYVHICSMYVHIRSCTYLIRRVRIQYDLRRMLYVYCTYLQV